MRVDPADAAACQCVTFHEHQNFAVRGHGRGRQLAHRVQDLRTLAQMTTRKFTDHERVAQHESILQHVRK